MNGNLNDLIRNYTIKYDWKIKKICQPLKNLLGVSVFAYSIIEEDGRFSMISNYPEQLDFYYQNNLFHQDNFLVHPKLLRSGCALIPLTPDPYYTELSRKLHKMNHLYLILKKEGNKTESFYFTDSDIDASNALHLINQTDLLIRFGRYFKREAKKLIDQSLADGYNLHVARGDSFFTRKETAPLSHSTPQRFLSDLTRLSPREQQCLDLFQEGKSAKMTAGILGLSHRTVEHYFESIKNKLGCASKQDLLDF